MSETKSKKEEKTEVGLADDGKERLEKTLSSRSVKALSLVLNGQVDLLSRKGAKVYSQNGGGTYHVTGNFCTCPDFQYREGNVCKHMRAYRIMKSLQKADNNSNLDG